MKASPHPKLIPLILKFLLGNIFFYSIGLGAWMGQTVYLQLQGVHVTEADSMQSLIVHRSGWRKAGYIPLGLLL